MAETVMLLSCILELSTSNLRENLRQISVLTEMFRGVSHYVYASFWRANQIRPQRVPIASNSFYIVFTLRGSYIF
jgi:hypothetical protein